LEGEGISRKNREDGVYAIGYRLRDKRASINITNKPQ